MPLIIEDGTGVTGADSFETVADCSAFAVAYWGQSLNGNTADKEAALRRAFVLLSVMPWKSDLWPTFGGAIPQAVKNAQSALARVEFQSPGSLSPVYDKSQAKTLTAVGSLQWTPKAGPSTVEAARPVVTMAADFLKAAGLLQVGLGGVTWFDRA
jgi:hypothetical protein